MIRPILTSYSYSLSADLKASKVAADGASVEFKSQTANGKWYNLCATCRCQ